MPPHDKTNKMACAASEDSDQPGHQPSLIRVRSALNLAKDPRFLHADTEDSDQTGRMPRLIRVFAWRTSFCWFCHEAAEMMLQIWYISDRYTFKVFHSNIYLPYHQFSSGLLIYIL